MASEPGVEVDDYWQLRVRLPGSKFTWTPRPSISAKNGTPGIHGLQGDQLRLLRALRREHPHADFVFLSERKAPLCFRHCLLDERPA